MTMKNALHGRPFSGTWGQLIFDEIKVKKDLTFDKGTLEHHGIVDFEKPVSVKIVFLSLCSALIRPNVSCFASKGAASGSILFELILKLLLFFTTMDPSLKV